MLLRIQTHIGCVDEINVEVVVWSCTFFSDAYKFCTRTYFAAQPIDIVVVLNLVSIGVIVPKHVSVKLSFFLFFSEYRDEINLSRLSLSKFHLRARCSLITDELLPAASASAACARSAALNSPASFDSNSYFA